MKIKNNAAKKIWGPIAREAKAKAPSDLVLRWLCVSWTRLQKFILYNDSRVQTGYYVTFVCR